MRALPLTDKARPGGRPRRTRAPRNAFADWLASCGLTPEKVAEELSKKLGREVSVSAIYNARNGYFSPGLRLAVAIEQMSTDPATGIAAVPANGWPRAKVRPRKDARRAA